MNEIKQLCQRIGTDFGIEDIALYIDFVPDELNSEEDLSALKGFKGHNEFGISDVKEIAEAVSLVLGSLGTFLALRKSWKKKNNVDKDLMIELWKNRMIVEGMDEEKATKISETFSKDLAKILDE